MEHKQKRKYDKTRLKRMETLQKQVKQNELKFRKQRNIRYSIGGTKICESFEEE
jgi:hypothetical protein